MILSLWSNRLTLWLWPTSPEANSCTTLASWSKAKSKKINIRPLKPEIYVTKYQAHIVFQLYINTYFRFASLSSRASSKHFWNLSSVMSTQKALVVAQWHELVIQELCPFKISFSESLKKPLIYFGVQLHLVAWQPASLILSSLTINQSHCTSQYQNWSRKIHHVHKKFSQSQEFTQNWRSGSILKNKVPYST